jgi:drug/metabolite transporter (DMT)-like permease
VGVVAIAAAIVSFALSTPIVKWSGEPGVVIAFWRMWFALGLWWVVMVATRRPFPDARTWKLVAPAGLLFGLNISTLFTAVTRTSIAHLEFISSLTPLVAVPASALLFKERPDFAPMKFGVISLVGVALVLFFGPSSGTSSLSGDLLVLLVVGIWTCYLMFTKRARARGVDTVTFMACMVPAGLLTTVPMAVVLEGDQIFSLQPRGWMVAALLAVLTGMVAHGCIAFAQQHLPIQTITVMQTAQPALAVLFAFFLLSEQVRWPQVIGMALVTIGITLFTLASQRNRSPRP